MRTHLESMNVKRAGAAPADTTALHTYSTVRIRREVRYKIRKKEGRKKGRR